MGGWFLLVLPCLLLAKYYNSYIFWYTCVYIYVCMYVCMYIYIHVYIYIMYIYIYICVSMYIYTYVDIEPPIKHVFFGCFMVVLRLFHHVRSQRHAPGCLGQLRAPESGTAGGACGATAGADGPWRWLERLVPRMFFCCWFIRFKWDLMVI